MSNPLKVTIELAALDNGSRVLNVAFDKIANKAASTAARVSKSALALSQKAALVGGLIAAPLAYATNQAIGFEEAMAGVSKVAGKGYEQGSKGLLMLGSQAKTSAVALGIGASNAGELMAALASGGVVTKDLADMTVTAGKVGIAFDLAAKDAGDSFVKMRNALGITNKEAKLAADSFNFISDRDASTAAQILTYMANGGASVARTLGIAAPKMATFGSALVSMGKSGEEAATIMLRFQKAIYLKGNEDMLASYKKAGRGAAGLMAVLKQGGNIKDTDKQFAYFARMGEYGTSVSQLAKSYGKLQTNMALVSKESNYSGSVDTEFKNRNSTVKGQLNKLKAEAGVLAVDLGTVLLPVIRDIVKDVAPLLRQLAGWIKANPTLTTQIVKGAAAMSVLSFAVSGVSGVVGGAAKAIDVLGPSFSRATRLATSFGAAMRNRAFEGTFKVYERFPKLGQGLFNLGGQFGRFGGILTRVFSGAGILPMIQGIGAAIVGITWPVALAIGAVALAAYVVYKNWDKLKPMFINTWRIIRNVAVGVYHTLAYYFGAASDYIQNKFAPVKALVTWIKNAFASIKMPDWLKSAGSWIGNKLSNAADASAGFANTAAARRGVSTRYSGAVRNATPSVGRSASPGPMLRVNGRNQAQIAAAGFEAPAPLGAPTPSGRSGGTTNVTYAPTIHLPAGTSTASAAEFKKVLHENRAEVARVVGEEIRKKERSKF